MIASVVLATAGTMVAASSLEEGAAAAPAPMIAPGAPRATGWRNDLDLQHWSTGSFHRDMVSVVQNLGTAHGPEQIGIMLNAAELYLTHMLLYEASSTLAGIDPTLPDHTRRHAALIHARALLNGEAISTFENSPLADRARPDTAFWRTLQAIAIGDVRMLDDNIEASFLGLGLQSRAVLRAMLPIFTEAAIETGHARYADAALELMRELPDLDQSSTGYFLRGRAQERSGNNSSALEAYFKAATGWDQYAVRARLAIADMSLSNGSNGALLAAQTTLTDGLEAWRGNQYELEVLKRLARVHAARGDDAAGLLALGKLIARFPGSQEAKLAKTQAEELLRQLYAKGKEGRYSLADWMDAHLQFLPFFRTMPDFARHTETFADYLLGLGATDLAAKEYQRASQLWREHESATSDTAAQDLFRLNLKLANSQYLAGLAQDARATLDLMDMVPGTQNAQNHAKIKASVLAELGDRSALLDTEIATPSSDHMRKLAQALAEEGQWENSKDMLEQLWAAYPEAFSVQDATHLLIAANRANDAQTRDMVIRAFPSLTADAPLVSLAESLNDTLPNLLPLRADQASARLRKLEDAFESIENSRISP